jgi:TfoX/Sxy family transcriptional regulator of competence genes
MRITMAYSEELAGRVRAVAKVRPTVSEKKMFGGVAFMLNGNMFCGVSQDALMARVGPEQYAAALAKPHVRVMDFTGRVMKGYVYVDPAGMADDENLRYWVELCAEYVLTLPPK